MAENDNTQVQTPVRFIKMNKNDYGNNEIQYNQGQILFITDEVNGKIYLDDDNIRYDMTHESSTLLNNEALQGGYYISLLKNEQKYHSNQIMINEDGEFVLGHDIEAVDNDIYIRRGYINDYLLISSDDDRSKRIAIDKTGKIELFNSSPGICFGPDDSSNKQVLIKYYETMPNITSYSTTGLEINNFGRDIIYYSQSTNSSHLYVTNLANHSFKVALTMGGSGGNHGVWSSGHGANLSDGKWLVVRNGQTGEILMNVNASLKSSDRRLKNFKNNINTNESLIILRNIPLINFTYKNSEELNSGVFAQDVRDVLLKNNIPNYSLVYAKNVKEEEAIPTCDISLPEEDVEYSVDYTKFIPILWDGWKYLDKEVEKLKQENEELRYELDELKAMIGG